MVHVPIAQTLRATEGEAPRPSISLNPKQVKAMLIQHVQACENSQCVTCDKLRIRRMRIKKVHEDMMRRLTTPLHHVSTLTPAQVRELLVGGASIHASDGGTNAPTPLSIARDLLKRSHPNLPMAHVECAQLIVDASLPWSPRTHALFPAAAKKRALDLLLIGLLLSSEHRFEGQAYALMDVWPQIMAHAVER